jgi:hypothetical protein
VVPRRGPEPRPEPVALPLPQAVSPYADLVAENDRRGRPDPEYELPDTGVFEEDRYRIVEVHHAKADPTGPGRSRGPTGDFTGAKCRRRSAYSSHQPQPIKLIPPEREDNRHDDAHR